MAKNTKLEEFAKLSRSYRKDNDVIKKVFNRGQGLISLIEFTEKDGKKICIYNKLYATKKDIENITEFFGNDYEIIGIELGYPDWYTKTLRTKYREQGNNFACGKGNFSFETVINDANMNFKKEYCLFDDSGIVARKQNAEKKEYLSWGFDKNGNMTDFSKGDAFGHNEFVQFLGNRVYLKETFYDDVVKGTNKFDVIVYSPEKVEVRQNGDMVNDEEIINDYKEKAMSYKYATKTFAEIEKSLKKNGYKKNQNMNFSIIDDTKDVLRAGGKLAGNVVKDTLYNGGILMF